MIDSKYIRIYNNISMSQNDVRTVKCPFIPHHVMPYERFLSHLEKCQFPDKKNYSKCRFNPYHVYHMSALAEHEKKCPDQKKYQSYQDDDDDWGVEDVPQKSELNSQEQEYSNYGSSFSYSSEPKNSKAKKSDIGKKQQNSSKVPQKTQKTTIKKQFQAMDLDDFNSGKVIDNSHFEAMDLDDFNPCEKR